MEQTYLEGVENCVTKNLYMVLFGDNGVGIGPTDKNNADPNIPTEPIIQAVHRMEAEQNNKIRDNIARFGNFL